MAKEVYTVMFDRKQTRANTCARRHPAQPKTQTYTIGVFYEPQ